MTHEFLSVEEVLNKYKVIYVPYYQRNYVWGQKNDGRNLYKFIDDIFSQYRDNPSSDYFIGTLAFCSARVNDVIDGQQRLTSLVLILTELAKLKCSGTSKNKNKALLEPVEGKFVIQEEFYLTEELKYNLGIDNNFNSQRYNVNISKTIDRIVKQINDDWSGYTDAWYDGLYDYILKHVRLISLEYSNISESLKYFLNINSLSIQLTQSDIFFSILSQAIRLAGTGDSIFTIKQKVSELGKLKGIDNKDIDGYKGCDDNKEKGLNNIIYIFLNAFYKGDSNISYLEDAGVGKWMSFYKNEVFNDAIKAKEFTEKFTQYLKDFKSIYSYFSNMGVSLNPTSSLYVTWILLQYEAYFDIARILTDLFRSRHNYKKDDRIVTYEDCMQVINKLKFNQRGDLFARERNSDFKSIIGNIYQSFDGEDVYPSVELKAANLLYFIVKDHAFIDGNKRIAASIFLYFMNFYGLLYRDGKTCISNNTLAALTLLIAESKADEKELIIDVVMNIVFG